MELRIRKQLHFALLLLFWVAISSEAHLGGRVFPIPYLTDEMVENIQLDDGSVHEWIELVGEPTMTLLDFVEERWQSPFDPSSLDFRIWLAWHDDPARIYLAFVGSDDVYKNTQDYSVDWIPSLRDDFVWGQNDCIALAIDGDHSGGAGLPPGGDSPSEDLLRASGETQYYEAIARTAGGPTLEDSWTRYGTDAFPWTVLPPYATAGGNVAGEAPVISVIELYITPFDRWGDAWDSPEGSVISTLRADQIIGFSIGVLDNDLRTEGLRPNFWVPEPIFSGGYSDIGYDEVFRNMWNRVANTFLDGLLLPEGQTAPVEDTAVVSVSWGRIKAALEME